MASFGGEGGGLETRVTGVNNSPVVSKVLEDAALANTNDVVAGLQALTN
ncbi:MAG: hypothetical protein ACKVG6_05865 [Alphaproteobacteria bacterium]